MEEPDIDWNTTTLLFKYISMILLTAQTSIILFKTSHKFFFPQLFDLEGEDLKIVNSSMILSLIIISRLKLDSYVEYICKASQSSYLLVPQIFLFTQSYPALPGPLECYPAVRLHW